MMSFGRVAAVVVSAVVGITGNYLSVPWHGPFCRSFAIFINTWLAVLNGEGIDEVNRNVTGLRGEMNGIRGEMNGLRSDMQNFRTEVLDAIRESQQNQ